MVHKYKQIRNEHPEFYAKENICFTCTYVCACAQIYVYVFRVFSSRRYSRPQTQGWVAVNAFCQKTFCCSRHVLVRFNIRTFPLHFSPLADSFVYHAILVGCSKKGSQHLGNSALSFSARQRLHIYARARVACVRTYRYI